MWVDTAVGSVLVEARYLKKYFPVQRGLLRKVAGYGRAVDDVSFEIRESETLGLIGESGCGKTTIGRMILRVYPPISGEVLFQRKGRRIIYRPFEFLNISVEQFHVLLRTCASSRRSNNGLHGETSISSTSPPLVLT